MYSYSIIAPYRTELFFRVFGLKDGCVVREIALERTETEAKSEGIMWVSAQEDAEFDTRIMPTGKAMVYVAANRR